MTWLQASVVGNIILGVIVAIFALDRINFRKTCELRHNPIDEAIHRIENKLNQLYDKFIEHLKGDK